MSARVKITHKHTYTHKKKKKKKKKKKPTSTERIARERSNMPACEASAWFPVSISALDWVRTMAARGSLRGAAPPICTGVDCG